MIFYEKHPELHGFDVEKQCYYGYRIGMWRDIEVITGRTLEELKAKFRSLGEDYDTSPTFDYSLSKHYYENKDAENAY